ncbi:MAG: hypothetical protein SNJ53_00295, partial [Thermodesulfovibrionales bacterium]
MKKVLLILSIFILFCIIVYINIDVISSIVLSHFTGYQIRFQDITLSTGEIKGIDIKDADIDISIQRLNVNMPFQSFLRNKIDALHVEGPKIHLIHTSTGQTDLSFLKKMPKIEQLTITKGMFVLTSKASDYDIKLFNLYIDIRDYSPKSGGKITLTARLEGKVKKDIDLAGDVRVSASIITSQGDIVLKGNFFTDIHSIKGPTVNVRGLNLSGDLSYISSNLSIKNAQASTNDITIMAKQREFLIRQTRAYLDFDSQDTSLNLYDLTSKIDKIGVLKGGISAFFKDQHIEFSSAFVLQDIDVKKGVEVLSALTSKDFRDFDISGRGKINADLKGIYSDDRLDIKSGKAEITLNDGAFASIDGLKMGQDISGKIIFNFDNQDDLKKNKTAQVLIIGELSRGEFLWDRFYYNHQDNPIIITGNLYRSTKDEKDDGFSLLINTNLLNTGSYDLAIHFTPQKVLNAVLTDLNLKKIYSLFVRENVASILPNLKDSEISG